MSPPYCLSWALLLVTQCTTGSRLAVPEGRSQRPSALDGTRTDRGGPAAPAVAVERLDGAILRGLVAASEALYESRGHDPPRFLIRVLVSPGAREAYRNLVPGTSVPAGTWLAAEHLNRAKNPVGLWYWMHRGTGGWEFRVTDQEGSCRAFPEATCRGCHAQSATDWMFGLPHSLLSATPSPAAATSAE